MLQIAGLFLNGEEKMSARPRSGSSGLEHASVSINVPENQRPELDDSFCGIIVELWVLWRDILAHGCHYLHQDAYEIEKIGPADMT